MKNNQILIKNQKKNKKSVSDLVETVQVKQHFSQTKKEFIIQNNVPNASNFYSENQISILVNQNECKKYNEINEKLIDKILNRLSLLLRKKLNIKEISIPLIFLFMLICFNFFLLKSLQHEMNNEILNMRFLIEKNIKKNDDYQPGSDISKRSLFNIKNKNLRNHVLQNSCNCIHGN